MMIRKLALAVAWAALAVAQTAPTIENLRCEYLVNPLGIDVEKPRLSWVRRAGAQSAYQILVASTAENLERNRGDVWDSSKVASPRSMQIVYAGRALASGKRYHWKVRHWDEAGRASAWSRPALWSMGLLRESDWQGAFIGPARPAGSAEGTPLPFPWLRKTVALKQKPREATAYVNALGYYELYINGKKVDDHVLSPAVSDYSKRTLYVAHDVSSYLVEGNNTVALWLGRGWYVAGHPGVIHDAPLVRAQIDIIFADASAGRIATDKTWKVRASPITAVGKGKAFGDYGGEHYDARLELDGWNSVALDDSGWAQAAEFQPPRVLAAAQMVEPNRTVANIAPVSIQEGTAGDYLVDMGKNYVGWFELRLPASTTAGRDLRLEYADARPTSNRFMMYNQRDEYVTRAGAGQVVRSRFNYHGAQYVHIIGLQQKPSLDDIKGFLIRTDYKPASSFESSNELFNRIYRVTNWTFENLTLGGYVVDCPTRERLGYGGDAGTSIETGMFNFDTAALYTKWLSNWHDAQAPNGDLPYTAPAYPEQGGGGPMWSGFTVTLPWHLYLQYGDKRALEISYPRIRKWLDFVETKTKGGVLEPYLSYGITPPQWNFLGDWVTPRSNQAGPRDPKATQFINNAHYLYQLQIASKVAAILGRKEDQSAYNAKAAGLSATLHESFFDAVKGVYINGEQAYQAMPLMLGITPVALRGTVAKNIEDSIVVKNKGHLDSGMHGTYFLLKHLMEADRNDLIFAFASKTDYPSWGNMLEQGATTMWESWSGGSHIHDTLISIGSWFIQGIGGIRIDESSPGFTHFLIKPAIVGDLTFARTRYESIHGTIASNWRKEGGKVVIDVTVPPGTTASVSVGSATFQVKAGQHQFTATVAN